jgi:uncharacterized protein (DUF58 family)
MHIRKGFWIFCSILLVSLLFAILSNETIFYRIFYFSLLLIIFSYFWTIFSRNAINITRHARNRHRQVGTIFEERFTVINRYPFWQLWVEIFDQSNLPGTKGSKILYMIKPKAERVYQSNTRLTQRGEFTLGPTEIRVGDPFGLFKGVKVLQGKETLLIIPLHFDIDHFASLAGQLSGGKAMRKISQDATPYASGVRDYRVGDSLSRIHWRSTAKRQHLMVKEFDQDPQANVWILLDSNRASRVSSPSENFQSEEDQLGKWKKSTKFEIPPDTFEYNVIAAATIAKYYIRLGRAVGFASIGNMLSYLSAERGERQFGKIIDELAFIRCEGKLPLTGLLQSQIVNFTHGSTIILVTSTKLSELEFAVTYLLQRKMRTIVAYTDPDSFKKRPKKKISNDWIPNLGFDRYLIRLGDDIKSILDYSPK